jgi:recombination protein RecT
MVRSSQLLHPARQIAPVRHAATVLLLRDTPQGPEVLLTRRSEKASFAPGEYVFPGGVIDAVDAQSHALAARRSTQTDAQLTEAIAAIRESFEELGVLLARHADGSFASAADVAAMDRQAPFAMQCAERGLVLAADAVFTLAHWTTSRDRPKRFATIFLVARMPEGDQQPVADDAEQFDPVWRRPADALARHAEGSFSMMFPTIRTLERLAAYADVDAVLHACAARNGVEVPLWKAEPRGGLKAGKADRFMDEEAPFGELALVCPDGHVEHALDWQSERPVALLKNVQRLTAPNAARMTGPGTNSYLVGDASSGYIAIDPGPDDAGHIARLHAAAGGDIRMIVCTHSHPDHSPGAQPLQALCSADGRQAPPILGLPSAPTARDHSRFTPDRSLSNGELLALSGNALGHYLTVIFTPGHAANHLCLLLAEDGLLFSGDHILNGSTTVVDPPDGDMEDYLRSLDLLADTCVHHDIEFILPAHGYVLHDAPNVIARLKAHRLAREAKVAAAMAAVPDGAPADWLPLAYDDVPRVMWPVAERSLIAHADRLRRMQAASTPDNTAPGQRDSAA